MQSVSRKLRIILLGGTLSGKFRSNGTRNDLTPVVFVQEKRAGESWTRRPYIVFRRSRVAATGPFRASRLHGHLPFRQRAVNERDGNGSFPDRGSYAFYVARANIAHGEDSGQAC